MSCFARSLLAAAAVFAFGCGPEDPVTTTEQQAPVSTEAQLDGVPPEPEPTFRLVIVQTEEGLMFKLVNDPVEERFFYETDVTQPAPPMPTPPCPNCR